MNEIKVHKIKEIVASVNFKLENLHVCGMHRGTIVDTIVHQGFFADSLRTFHCAGLILGGQTETHFPFRTYRALHDLLPHFARVGWTKIEFLGLVARIGDERWGCWF